ncbi:hypothetical protein [Senegalia massiliensis]|uniref:Uncharacterized protein n=1 Tax=Senegalia massiliensis TaxID=1720316 RepID=A0A845R2A0_9CLOT|nr:hypothetical protein [Senegalia massiliensis]NBI07552.1 hypothetical protein [Senegalia massiliensis]
MQYNTNEEVHRLNEREIVLLKTYKSHFTNNYNLLHPNSKRGLKNYFTKNINYMNEVINRGISRVPFRTYLQGVKAGVDYLKIFDKIQI